VCFAVGMFGLIFVGYDFLLGAPFWRVHFVFSLDGYVVFFCGFSLWGY